MDDASNYASVRGLTRGLQVLQAMNTADGGRMSIAEVTQATGLHRTTVRRLLETLINAGFVRHSASDKRYSLSLQVRSLSEGFRDEDWIPAVVAPALSELLQDVVWPSDLTTPQGTAMVIRESTHRFSPLSFHRAMVGQHMPMLSTAAGRAYLSACPDTQRNMILAAIRAGDDEQARLAQDARLLRNILQRTQEAGYGSNDSEWSAHRKIGAIALPICHAGQALGAINVIYLSKVIGLSEAVRRFLPPLRQAVQRVERELATFASTNTR